MPLVCHHRCHRASQAGSIPLLVSKINSAYSLEEYQLNWVEQQTRIYRISKSEVVRRAITYAMTGRNPENTTVIRDVDREVLVEIRETKVSFNRRARVALQQELQNWNPKAHNTVAKIVYSFLSILDKVE